MQQIYVFKTFNRWFFKKKHYKTEVFEILQMKTIKIIIKNGHIFQIIHTEY